VHGVSISIATMDLLGRLLSEPAFDVLRTKEQLGYVVSRAFSSWNRSISTEIYLCHACSDHEIEDGNGRAGVGRRAPHVRHLRHLLRGALGQEVARRGHRAHRVLPRHLARYSRAHIFLSAIVIISHVMIYFSILVCHVCSDLPPSSACAVLERGASTITPLRLTAGAGWQRRWCTSRTSRASRSRWFCPSCRRTRRCAARLRGTGWCCRRTARRSTSTASAPRPRRSATPPPPSRCCVLFALRRPPVKRTGAGGDHGIDHHKNWLRFPYDSTFLRSHYLHPHPYVPMPPPPPPPPCMDTVRMTPADPPARR
jgi:hypothetical protein